MSERVARVEGGRRGITQRIRMPNDDVLSHLLFRPAGGSPPLLAPLARRYIPVDGHCWQGDLPVNALANLLLYIDPTPLLWTGLFRGRAPGNTLGGGSLAHSLRLTCEVYRDGRRLLSESLSAFAMEELCFKQLFPVLNHGTRVRQAACPICRVPGRARFVIMFLFFLGRDVSPTGSTVNTHCLRSCNV